MTEPFDDVAVQAAFDAHPEPVRARLLGLRAIILATAAETPGVGDLVETLKWGEPAYLPRKARTGTTIRINGVKRSPDRYGAYFNCNTTLLQTFRMIYPQAFTFEGERALIFSVQDDLPEAAVRHCVALALTYHLQKR
jgi:hypothetical protein